MAALAFAGPAPALCLIIGAGLGASALAGFGSALDSEDTPAQLALQASWARVGCGFAAAAGTGVIGFVTAGGSVRFFTFVLSEPALAAATAVVLFLFSLLGWKAAWSAIAIQRSARISWNEVVAPYLLLVFALGMVWTGTATGDAIVGQPDRLFRSLLSIMFGPSSEAWGDESAYATASAVHWGLLFVAILAGYWTAGRSKDFWSGVAKALPRFSTFVLSGYGIDALFVRVIELLSRLGGWSVWLVDRKTWGEWIPVALAVGVRRGSSFVASGDRRLSWWISGVARRWVETPAKMLQVIQSGDVQWYLFFAVGSGIAILAHFMRTNT